MAIRPIYRPSMLTLAILTLTASGSASWAAQIPKGIPEEAVTAWRAYAERKSLIGGTIKLTEHLITNGQARKTLEAKYDIKQAPSCLLLNEKQSTEVVEKVYAVNRKYAFEVVRNQGQDGWFVGRLDVPKKTSFAGMGGLPLEQEIDALLLAPVCALRVPLLDFVGQKTFSVRAVSRETYDSSECLRVVFRNEHSTREEQGVDRFNPQSGNVLLDPGRHYVIREGTWRCQLGGRDHDTVTKLEYVDDPSGLPLMKRGEVSRTTNGFTTRTAVECDLQVGKNYDESQFSLSHFGLPEPEGHEISRPLGYHWWILGVAGVAALIGLGFRKLAARARPAARA